MTKLETYKKLLENLDSWSGKLIKASYCNFNGERCIWGTLLTDDQIQVIRREGLMGAYFSKVCKRLLIDSESVYGLTQQEITRIIIDFDDSFRYNIDFRKILEGLISEEEERLNAQV